MAETYSVYFGTKPGNLDLIIEDLEDTEIIMPVIGGLNYDTTYYWRVDTTNEEETVTGDTWNFTTIAFLPPVSYGGVDEDGDGYGDGTGYDLATQKRLVIAQYDSIFYEDI